ncbi:hypothetical protein DSECCO2_542160 [anaerobic digester metagenome]
MLRNFQLAAVTKKGRQVRLFRIPIRQQLQIALAENWQRQYATFMQNIQEIDFNACYYPEKHERFCLSDYELPDWLQHENNQTIPNLDAISDNETFVDSIKSIVGFARNEQDEELILFQNFSLSHIIRPGRSLFLQNNIYETAHRPGLTLEGKLSALYCTEERKLLFRNFRTVNTFLPLADYYEEASEQQIREVLNHRILASENPDALAVNANQWFSKRFALLRDSGILNQYSTQEICDRSQGYDINIQLEGGRIVFPADKVGAKRLLQFLNEEIYRGAITETLYETNSKREADL